jgi:hypothetical protein
MAYQSLIARADCLHHDRFAITLTVDTGYVHTEELAGAEIAAARLVDAIGDVAGVYVITPSGQRAVRVARAYCASGIVADHLARGVAVAVQAV